VALKNVEEAVEFIRDHAPLFAKAKAERTYIEKFLPSKKAILMKASGLKTSAAQETEALSDPAYIELLEGLKEAVYQEELLKHQMNAAEIRVDIWRSQEASNRRMDRVTQ
jgi:hypothetical protein